MQEEGVDLERSVGYRLKQATTALHDAMDAALGPLGLTITQYSTLELLAQRPGLSGAQLARGAFVTRQSMSAVLEALLRAGLVARAGRAPQGRALPVELTGAGRDRRAAASAVVRDVERRMLAGVADDETARLAALLDSCSRALGADVDA